jgi:hypothetical protein
MEPQHVIVTAIACNETPRLSRMDGGIARRVDITNFKYKFVDHVLHPEFQRPLDAAVRRNCKANAQWRDALLHMLIKRVPLVLGLSETAFGSLAIASGLIRRSLKVGNVYVGIQRNDAASDTE